MSQNQFDELHGNPSNRHMVMWTELQPHGIPSYNHNASVRSTTLLPLEEWPRLEWLSLGQYICPSPIRSIWQLWIGRYTHIPAVALVTARFRCYSRAAFVGVIFSRLQYFWANSCFLTSTTLLRSLALLYVGKTNCSIISYHMIGCILVLHMNLRIHPRLPVRCSFLCLQMKTLCRTL